MQMENKTPPVFPEPAPGAAGPAHQTHPLEAPIIPQSWCCGTAGAGDRWGWDGQRAPAAPANARG